MILLLILSQTDVFQRLAITKSQCKTKARNEILLLFSTETPLIVEQF